MGDSDSSETETKYFIIPEREENVLDYLEIEIDEKNQKQPPIILKYSDDENDIVEKHEIKLENIDENQNDVCGNDEQNEYGHQEHLEENENNDKTHILQPNFNITDLLRKGLINNEVYGNSLPIPSPAVNFIQKYAGEIIRKELENANRQRQQLEQTRTNENNTVQNGTNAVINGKPESRPHKCKICGKGFPYPSKLLAHETVHSGNRPFQCNICNKTFKGLHELNLHRKIHLGDRPFNCSYCGKNFKEAYSLKVHIRTHTGEKPYCCGYCDKTFTENCHLVAHLRIHTGEKPFKCDGCDKSFHDKGSLVKHRRIHSNEKPYVCHTCDWAFRDSSSLSKHRKRHNFYPEFTCLYCKKSFDTQVELKTHTKIHTSKETIYKCHFCDEGFTNTHHLTVHKKQYHLIKQKCRICSNEFDTLNELNLHVELEHVGQNGTVKKAPPVMLKIPNLFKRNQPRDEIENDSNDKCEILGKVYENLTIKPINKNTEQNNQIRSLRSPPRLVPINSLKNFNSKNMENNSIEEDNEMSDENQSIDRQQQSKEKPQLLQQLKNQTIDSFIRQIKPSTSNVAAATTVIVQQEKPITEVVPDHLRAMFKCDVCRKVFRTQKKLRVHKRVHNQNLPYKCDQCPNAFAVFSALERHKVVHSDYRPYKCSFCEKRFKRKSHVYRHERTHFKAAAARGVALNLSAINAQLIANRNASIAAGISS